PVSTTHAVVGGVVGAGIISAGLGIVNWPTIGAVAASWVVSPVMGGIIAAIFLVIIRVTITTRLDKITSARIWVPVFVAVMTGIFAMYLATKGLSRVWKPGWGLTILLGLAFGLLGWI